MATWAGIKGATIHVEGKHAFGWLRTETGVHRAGQEIAVRIRVAEGILHLLRCLFLLNWTMTLK